MVYTNPADKLKILVVPKIEVVETPGSFLAIQYRPPYMVIAMHRFIITLILRALALHHNITFMSRQLPTHLYSGR